MLHSRTLLLGFASTGHVWRRSRFGWRRNLARPRCIRVSLSEILSLPVAGIDPAGLDAVATIVRVVLLIGES